MTAHVVEAFAKLGISGESSRHGACARRGWKAEQEADGPWFGRWGVNYIYGTSAALPALNAIGEDMSQPYVAKACDWLVARQQADGGWGESCASYMNLASAGRGATTASQTAWALMGLLAVNRPQDQQTIDRGLVWLVETPERGNVG